MPTLIIQTDESGGAAVPLSRSPVTVGRDGGSDVALDAPPVSPLHATLREESARWYVKDEGSLYGTFVNHRRVTEQGLKHGDVIELGLGGPSLRFESEEPASSDEEEPITLEQAVPDLDEEPSSNDPPAEPPAATTGVFRTPTLDSPTGDEETTVELDAPASREAPSPPELDRRSPPQGDLRDGETTMELELPRSSGSRLRGAAVAVGALVVLALAVVLVRSCGTPVAGMEAAPRSVSGAPVDASAPLR